MSSLLTFLSPIHGKIRLSSDIPQYFHKSCLLLPLAITSALILVLHRFRVFPPPRPGYSQSSPSLKTTSAYQILHSIITPRLTSDPLQTPNLVSIQQKFICHQFVTRRLSPSSTPPFPVPRFHTPRTFPTEPKTVAITPFERNRPPQGDPLPHFSQNLFLRIRESVPRESIPQLLPISQQ